MSISRSSANFSNRLYRQARIFAEGRSKHSQREFLRFLEIALGSAGELQYQLQSAIDVCAMPEDEGAGLNKRAEEVAKMIQGLINKIKRDLGDED